MADNAYLSYYQRNKDLVLNKEKDYYKNNKDRVSKQAREKYNTEKENIEEINIITCLEKKK